MKSPAVIVQQKGRRGAVELTPAELTEILTSLHCRRSARSRTIIDKLTKALHAEAPSRACKDQG